MSFTSKNTVKHVLSEQQQAEAEQFSDKNNEATDNEETIMFGQM